MPDWPVLALNVIIARDTGAELSEWECSFIETMRLMLEENRMWLSGGQRRSLLNMCEKLELWSNSGLD